MSSYQETIAELRAAAANREIRDKEAEAESWLADMRSCEKQAAEFEADGDRQNALISAQSANEAEAELNRVLAQLPQQQPQLSEADQAFAARHRDFIDRYGQKAIQAIGHCYAYATRPKNPNTNDPSRTGMGLTRESPELYEAVSGLLEMYGSGAGLRFDPEGSLDPNEAARISGISGREWNAQAEKMISEGHDSGSVYGKQWSRKIG